MNIDKQRMMTALAVAAAIAFGALRSGLAQTAIPAPPGEAELNLLQANEPQQNQAVPSQAAAPGGFDDLFSRQAVPRLGQQLDEIRRLIDDASRLVQDAGQEDKTKAVATRLSEIVERLRQLDGREANDPLASARERAASAPLFDPQRMEELRKLLVELQAAHSRDQKEATSQKIQQALQRAKAIVARRRGTEGSQPPAGQSSVMKSGGLMTSNAPAAATIRSPGDLQRKSNDPFSGAAMIAPATGAPQDNEWRQTVNYYESQIHQAADSLRTATGDEQKAAAKKQLGELLNQYFDQDLRRRQEELARIEERVKNLRSQLTKRQEKKQELIDLQIKVVENEADGLGFFNAQGDGHAPDYLPRGGRSPWERMTPPAANQVQGQNMPVSDSTPAQRPTTQRNPPATGGLDDLFPPAAGGAIPQVDVPVEQALPAARAK
jgi:hypothetical protein